MPTENSVSLADGIAAVAFLVAILSSVYARRAWVTAERANAISTRESLRPLRLQVYRALHEFAHYCSTYWTLYHMQEVEGTRDLVQHIETFEWEIEQHGHLGMPNVDERARQFLNGAWKMQRLIDRIAGGQNDPHDPPYTTAEENLHGLIDWFAAERRGLKALFAPYLAAP